MNKITQVKVDRLLMNTTTLKGSIAMLDH